MRAAVMTLATACLVGGCAGRDTGTTAPEPSRTAATARPAARPSPAPAPHAAIPRGPVRLSARLASVSLALRDAIGVWRATHPGRRARPPQRIVLLALYEQRVDRRLARRPRLAARTTARLPPRVRAQTRDSAGALRALFRLTGPPNEHRFRTGPARPPDVLLGYYRAARDRFGVHWSVLAAVNFIESNFGRLRNASSAGAVGPMQFLPATWRAVGLGGNVRDPHDAILGAANYLHLSGAPADHARALYAYNPSRLYVEAALRFARRIARDRSAYYAYWSWQSFRRSARGDVQLTGPGALPSR